MRWILQLWLLWIIVVAGPAPARQTPPLRNTHQSGHSPGPKHKDMIRAIIAGIPIKARPADAVLQLAHRLDRKLDVPILLTDGVRRVRRTRRQLGVGLDAARMVAKARKDRGRSPLYFWVNIRRMQQAIRPLTAIFDSPARDASILDTGDRVRIIPGRAARRLNAPYSTQLLARAIVRHPARTRLHLAVRQTPPRIPTAALRGINGRLARFSTTFYPHGPHSGNRNHNMMLGIWAIDRTVLRPGATFSFNRAAGERTPDRGYRTGIMFAQGKTVEGIGAGLSQTAGTLCNAALLAGLPMVEFRTHSHPVSYLPIGRDGTIAAGSFDMKFRNNTKAPIYIAFKVAGDRIIATLYGRPVPGQAVKLTVREYRLGPGHSKTILERTILRNGKVVKQERIGTSDYHWEAGRK